ELLGNSCDLSLLLLGCLRNRQGGDELLVRLEIPSILGLRYAPKYPIRYAGIQNTKQIPEIVFIRRDDAIHPHVIDVELPFLIRAYPQARHRLRHQQLLSSLLVQALVSSKLVPLLIVDLAAFARA